MDVPAITVLALLTWSFTCNGPDSLVSQINSTTVLRFVDGLSSHVMLQAITQTLLTHKFGHTCNIWHNLWHPSWIHNSSTHSQCKVCSIFDDIRIITSHFTSEWPEDGDKWIHQDKRNSPNGCPCSKKYWWRNACNLVGADICKLLKGHIWDPHTNSRWKSLSKWTTIASSQFKSSLVRLWCVSGRESAIVEQK